MYLSALLEAHCQLSNADVILRNFADFVLFSSVFDPDGENHEEYKKIHSSYKSLVCMICYTVLFTRLSTIHYSSICSKYMYTMSQ